jgi:hypothetical protein
MSRSSRLMCLNYEWRACWRGFAKLWQPGLQVPHSPVPFRNKSWWNYKGSKPAQRGKTANRSLYVKNGRNGSSDTTNSAAFETKGPREKVVVPFTPFGQLSPGAK